MLVAIRPIATISTTSTIRGMMCQRFMARTPLAMKIPNLIIADFTLFSWIGGFRGLLGQIIGKMNIDVIVILVKLEGIFAYFR
jgi:hypothetical protein